MEPYPGLPRHHPITFANETHGFVWSGSNAASDMYSYHPDSKVWTIIDTSTIPAAARSFGYGVTIGGGPDASSSLRFAYLGLGVSHPDGRLLDDWWQFDTQTLQWTQLQSFPGGGRRHPANTAVYLDGQWHIYVGLGDNATQNFNDWWSYSVTSDSWTRLHNFPGTPRHHPFYFSLGRSSFVGLGHSDGSTIERDWYEYADHNVWTKRSDFASYDIDNNNNLITTEARVAGTQFAVTIGNRSLGFVLSGDGDDHNSMATGEFHLFDDNNDTGHWQTLPSHPGTSRWAPGSFVIGDSVYFTSGYDRTQQLLFRDLWKMNLSELFFADAAAVPSPNRTSSNNDTVSRAITGEMWLVAGLVLLASSVY